MFTCCSNTSCRRPSKRNDPEFRRWRRTHLELIEKTSGRIVFRFHQNGRAQLVSLLQCYPLPVKWDVELSRNDPDGELEEDRQFLEETLEKKREAMAEGLQRFLDSPTIFQSSDEGDFLRLPMDRVDWLLQVLNDLRISAWRLLGCPDGDEKKALEELIQGEMPMESMQKAQLFILLELAGYYQSVILDGIMDE